MNKNKSLVLIGIIILVAGIYLFTANKKTSQNYFLQNSSNDEWCEKLPIVYGEYYASMGAEDVEQILKVMDKGIEQMVKVPQVRELHITKNELCANFLAEIDVSKKPMASSTSFAKFNIVQVSDLAHYIGEERAKVVLGFLRP